jgi:hypothetical protein
MGGAVSISAPEKNDKTFFMQQTINSKEAMTELFNSITSFGKAEGFQNSNSDLISLAEILLYIEKGANMQLSQHFKGMVSVIKEAFHYIVGYKEKTHKEIHSTKFHLFMNAMFMFSHLHEVSNVI